MHTYFVKKAGKSYDVDFANFTPEVQASILHAGLGRIINDLVAGAKNEKDSREAIDKKLAAWQAGEVRTATARTSDPVARRAFEIAHGKVVKAKGFIAWMQTNGLKLSSKESIKMANDKAKELAPDYLDEAREAIEREAALGDLDIDI
jgi:hypothetical protein